MALSKTRLGVQKDDDYMFMEVFQNKLICKDGVRVSLSRMICVDNRIRKRCTKRNQMSSVSVIFADSLIHYLQT